MGKSFKSKGQALIQALVDGASSSDKGFNPASAFGDSSAESRLGTTFSALLQHCLSTQQGKHSNNENKGFNPASAFGDSSAESRLGNTFSALLQHYLSTQQGKHSNNENKGFNPASAFGDSSAESRLGNTFSALLQHYLSKKSQPALSPATVAGNSDVSGKAHSDVFALGGFVSMA